MLARSLPRSVTGLLECFRGCFATPTFTAFTALVVGFWAQPGVHTVTGMLVAAGLSQSWQHTRAHRFFSQARWSADQLGLCLLDLVCRLLVPTSAPVRLVLGDTLYRRSGRKVFGAAWHHDPLGTGRCALAWANAWVVLGVLVDLPWCRRPVCVPILARLWRPRHTAGRLGLGCDLVRLVCQHLSTRRIDLACDGAYAGRALYDLPGQVTVTTRLRADARLFRLPAPRRAGTRGRPPDQRQPATRPDHARRHGDHPVRAGAGDPLRPRRHRRHRLLHLPVAQRVWRPPGPCGAGARPRRARRLRPGAGVYRPFSHRDRAG